MGSAFVFSEWTFQWKAILCLAMFGVALLCSQRSYLNVCFVSSLLSPGAEMSLMPKTFALVSSI